MTDLVPVPPADLLVEPQESAGLWVKPEESVSGPISLLPAIAELTRLYLVLAPLFRPQELPPPVIGIESRGRSVGKFGHYAARSWRRGGERHGELVLVSESLDRPIQGIVSTLVHEMVHHANALAGVRDCTVNQYHNGKFKVRAEGVGLAVRPQPPRGFARTEMTPALWDYVARYGPRAEAFVAFRAGRTPADVDAKAARPPKLVKLSCGCPVGVWAAAGHPFDLLCRLCGHPLRRRIPGAGR